MGMFPARCPDPGLGAGLLAPIFLQHRTGITPLSSSGFTAGWLPRLAHAQVCWHAQRHPKNERKEKEKAKAKDGPLGIKPSAVGPVPRQLPGKLQNAAAHKIPITNRACPPPPPSHSSAGKSPMPPSPCPLRATKCQPLAPVPWGWERAAEGNSKSSSRPCIPRHFATFQGAESLSLGRQAQRQQFISQVMVKIQQNAPG